MFNILIKLVILISLAIFIRGTLPRYRVDQVITLNWKFFIFILIIFFIEIILLILCL